jgi:transposase
MKKEIIKKASREFSIEERHQIIQEYFSSGCSKTGIWLKYTTELVERGHLSQWMRQLGYEENIRQRNYSFEQNINLMPKRNKPERPIIVHSESFETLQLKKRITELEKQLKDAEMKAIAFSTMVDIAEKEFNIPIRKKFNTKP